MAIRDGVDGHKWMAIRDAAKNDQQGRNISRIQDVEEAGVCKVLSCLEEKD